MQIGREIERIKRINAPAPIVLPKPERRPEAEPAPVAPERQTEPAPVAPVETPERQGGN